MNRIGLTVAFVMSLWPLVLRAADNSEQQQHATAMSQNDGASQHAVAAKTVSPPLPERRLAFTPKAIAGVPAHLARTMVDPVRSRLHSQSPLPQLYVLLPSQVAITTQAQPSLFWYLSEPIQHPIKLNINTSEDVEPVLTLSIDGSKIRGIQRLDLSRLAIKLKPGVRYEWVVTVVLDPDVPSEDINAKSVVWRVETPQSLAIRLQGADRRERAAIAAEEGIWIDALAGISDLIEHRPDDRSLRQDRADLLRQADFEVAIEPVANKTFEEKIVFQPKEEKAPER